MELAVAIGKKPEISPCRGQDEILIHSVLAGDIAAYRTLYERHAPRVYTFLYWNTKTVLRAEELTQDVFVKAWEKLHKFGFRSSFSTWLFGIAINILKTDIRKRSREAHRGASLDCGETSFPDTKSRRDEEVFDLRRAIGTLPDRARQVLILYEFDNYTHNEIAALLHISPGTSKAHLSRAKNLLRKEMET